MAKFTDTFLKLPVEVYDVKHKELTGEELLQDSYEKFNPFEIISYRPAYAEGDDDDNDELCTQIVLRSGDKALIHLPIEQFEKILNDFMDK